MRRNYTKIIYFGDICRIFTSFPSGLERSEAMTYEEARKESRRLNKTAKKLWKEHEANKPRRPFQSKEEE